MDKDRAKWHNGAMRAYPQELRYQVLRAVDEGTAREEIIARFHVSQATIKRYWHRKDGRPGMCCPAPFQGVPQRKKRPCCWAFQRSWKRTLKRAGGSIVSGGKQNMACRSAVLR